MITTEKRRRYDVYTASVHGGKWIGSSNNLERAMAIGERFGCRAFDCPCCKYEIFDNKLNTSDIPTIVKAAMLREERKGKRKDM